MTNEAGAIVFLIGLALLLLFFYGPWQSYCIDRVRLSLFKVRDDLFHLALKGEMTFSSREYKELRGSVEKLIRFAHRLTFGGIVIAMAVNKKFPKSNTKGDWTIAIENAKDAEMRKALESIRADIYKAIMRLIIRRSLLLMCIGWFIRSLKVLNRYTPNALFESAINQAEVEESAGWQEAQRTRKAA